MDRLKRGMHWDFEDPSYIFRSATEFAVLFHNPLRTGFSETQFSRCHLRWPRHYRHHRLRVLSGPSEMSLSSNPYTRFAPWQAGETTGDYSLHEQYERVGIPSPKCLHPPKDKWRTGQHGNQEWECVGDEKRGDHLPQITEHFCSSFAYVGVLMIMCSLMKKNENNKHV